jgi:hypothetical protein
MNKDDFLYVLRNPRNASAVSVGRTRFFAEDIEAMREAALEYAKEMGWKPPEKEKNP